ncbi:MAG: hypothetical protein AAGA65_26500 [Actinomycetota bacterium]
MNPIVKDSRPSIAIDFSCPGRLDVALHELVEPCGKEWQETVGGDFWFLRDTRGRDVLRLRLHSPDREASAFEAMWTKLVERFATAHSHGSDGEARAVRWTSVDPEPGPLVFGAGSFADDERYRRHVVDCLIAGSRTVLSNLPSSPTESPSISPQSLLARATTGCIGAASCVFGDLDPTTYLRYHRDTVLRSLVRKQADPSAKLVALIEQFDRRAASNSTILDSLAALWSAAGDIETSPLADWRKAVDGVSSRLVKAALLDDPEPFAEHAGFEPAFRLLHALANQLGIDRLNEALAIHLMLRARGAAAGDVVAMTPYSVKDHVSTTEGFPLIVRLSGVPATAVDAFGSALIGERIEAARQLDDKLKAARGELVNRLFERVPDLDTKQRTRALAIKRDAFNGRPLASHRRRNDWSTILGETEAVAERVVELETQLNAIEAETDAIYYQQLLAERRRILDWIEDPQLLRGITLASPRLADHLARLRRKPPERWGRKERSVERTVLRYLSRAALQISPFSTLTRVALGTASAHTDGLPATLRDTVWRERSLVQARRTVLDRFTAVLLRVPIVREALHLTLNETLDVTDSGKFRYIQPGRWTFDSEKQEMTLVGPANVQVALSGTLVDWLVEQTGGSKRPFRDVIALAQEAFGGKVAESTLRGTVEKLIEIGFLRLVEPWGSDALQLEPRILAHLDALYSSAADNETLKPVLKGFQRLLDLEREVTESDDPAAVLRRCDEALQELWQTLTTLAGLPTAIDWRPKAKTSICEDVMIESEVVSTTSDLRAFPERVADIDRGHLQRLAADVAPLVRLSNFFDRQHDLLSTLAAFAAERWPDRREIDFFTFFDAAQPLWREHTRFEAALRSKGREDGPETFNPLGLGSIEQIRRLREDVWSRLSSCKVLEHGRTRLDVERLNALLDRVPEPWAPLRDATLFLQPVDLDEGTWVLNTLFEELRYGCRYTALMSADLCARFTRYFEQRSKLLHEGEQVELIDVLCPGGRGVNVHALQTPRVLVVPGEHTDAEPSRQLTLDQLKVELPPSSWPRLRDADGQRLAPIYLGTTVLRFMPLLLKFLALFGPGTLKPLIPELAPRPLTADIRLQDRLWAGQVLLKRRRWLVSVASLREKLFSVDDAALFVRVQHWRLDYGLPSRVFIARRSGLDVNEAHYKPQYVDFSSPLSLALFRSTVEPMQREWIGLEEMIPNPDAGLARLSDGEERWAFEIQLDSFPLRQNRRTSLVG